MDSDRHGGAGRTSLDSILAIAESSILDRSNRAARRRRKQAHGLTNHRCPTVSGWLERRCTLRTRQVWEVINVFHGDDPVAEDRVNFRA